MFRHPLLLLLLAGSASAQTPASAPILADNALAVAPALARLTAADTVRAIHHLFAKRRRVGGVLTAGAVAADFALAGVSAANENTGHSSGGSGFGIPGNGPLLQFGFGGFALIYGIMAAPVMGVGIQQLIAYGPRREAKIVGEYETHRKLPAKIRRQLRKHLR
jgi:hypothetical protein